MNCGPTIVTERINKLMKLNKIESATSIADELHIDPSTVQKWVKGKSEPNPYNMLKLACYFDTTYEYIQGMSDDIEPMDIPKSGYT